MPTEIYPESIGIIIAGILLCLAGWQLFRISVYIIGFVLGASIGYVISSFAVSMGGNAPAPTWAPWVIILVSLVTGIIGIFLIKAVVKIALFLAGLLFGVVLVSLFTGSFEGSAYSFGTEMFLRNISVWSLLAGLVFGILFMFFEKWFVILYTGAAGAYILMLHLDAPPLLFYAMLVAGTVVQLWMSRGKKVRNLQITR